MGAAYTAAAAYGAEASCPPYPWSACDIGDPLLGEDTPYGGEAEDPCPPYPCSAYDIEDPAPAEDAEYGGNAGVS
ncbi:hypothetical protein Skr01_25250 [Sphaerisporangium krabiense]|nr:hypothetical protein Skr01_25250 [Sphaerisporangium krabiense]